MADDDDAPALSAETFAALQEFYAEQAKRQEILDKLQAEDKLKENVLFDENWVQADNSLIEKESMETNNEQSQNSENLSRSHEGQTTNQTSNSLLTQIRFLFWRQHGYTREDAKFRSQKPLADWPEYFKLINEKPILKRPITESIDEQTIDSKRPTFESIDEQIIQPKRPTLQSVDEEITEPKEKENIVTDTHCTPQPNGKDLPKLKPGGTDQQLKTIPEQTHPEFHRSRASFVNNFTNSFLALRQTPDPQKEMTKQLNGGQIMKQNTDPIEPTQPQTPKLPQLASKEESQSSTEKQNDLHIMDGDQRLRTVTPEMHWSWAQVPIKMKSISKNKQRRRRKPYFNRFNSFSQREMTDVNGGKNMKQNTEPIEPTQLNPPTEGSQGSAKEQTDLELMIYRMDDVPIDKAFAVIIRKKISEIIALGVKKNVGGRKMAFAKTGLLSEGYFLVTPLTIEARDWLQSHDFGSHDGTLIGIRRLHRARAWIWLPGKRENHPDNPMDYIKRQNDYRVELKQLSQFWYDETTISSLVRVVDRVVPAGGQVALVSCPTLFVPVKRQVGERANVSLLEYDRRFEVHAPHFIFYDYNFPDRIPKELLHTYDLVIADPPFLAEECITKTSQTIKLLAKDKIVVCTGAIMKENVEKLLNLKLCQFQPHHRNNLANEFSCYANFDLDGLLS